MSHVYLSGPMRGVPDGNAPAFARAAALWRGLGHRVWNPVEIGSRVFGRLVPPPEEFIREDLRQMLEYRIDTLALLPGWSGSVGCRVEAAVAVTLGCAFYDAESREKIATPRVIISHGYEKPAGVVPESLDVLAMEIAEWQRRTFPDATPISLAAHLSRELRELLADPTNIAEAADVFMLLVGLHDAMLPLGIRSKHEQNKRRVWGRPDHEGVVEHVREGGL
jgi:hypothetical protein